MQDLSEEQIKKRFAEGRGQGELAGYKPFLDHHDLSSLGRSSRVPSRKTGRIHHLFSDIETLAFLELIRMPEVIDIREQFPLDREDTRKIATEMGVTHPKNRNGDDVVMTTDLLVFVHSKSGPLRYARAGKPASELQSARTLEKLEIERRYWQRLGVHWSLVTDLDRTAVRATALQWLHGKEELIDDCYEGYWQERIAIFCTEFATMRNGTIEDFDSRLQRRGFQVGEMLSVLRHLAWHGDLHFDLDQEFNIRWSLKALVMANSAKRRAA